MSHALTHTTARTAKHAVRAFAQALDADHQDMSHEDAAALAAELREIFSSARGILHEIERADCAANIAHNLRDARYFTEEAVHLIDHAYPTEFFPAFGDQFTPITGTDDIKALQPGREMIVGGAVFRICQEPAGPTRIHDLTADDYWSPDDFIERFDRINAAIMLRR